MNFFIFCGFIQWEQERQISNVFCAEIVLQVSTLKCQPFKFKSNEITYENTPIKINTQGVIIFISSNYCAKFTTLKR